MPLKSRDSHSHRPFRALRELVERGEIRLVPSTGKPARPPKKVDASLSDEEAFRQAMEEVRPLGWSETPLRLPRPVHISSRAEDERGAMEALTGLQALLDGEGELDPFATGEGVEGAPSRRGRSYLGRLKKGEFSVQSHLDLHGMNLEEARRRLEAFVREAVRQGHSCVRIVHGRGRHSRGEPAVLKTHVTRWLSSKKMGRNVVAFASARSVDGGGGAVYVLLCRKRGSPRS
ncbi:MAG: Smr/MutS family protein [Acidobacteriota bacterium]